MRFMRTIVRVVLLTVLVVCLIVFILLLSLNQYLYPDLYIKALEKNNLYEYLEQQGGIDSQLTLTTLSEEGVKPAVDRIIVESLAYVRSERKNPRITIQINTTALREYLENETAQLSLCEENEDPFGNENVTCRPVNMSISEFLNRTLEKQNSSILKQSEVNFLDVYDKERNIEKARLSIRMYTLFLYLLPLLMTVVIVAVWLLSQRDIRTTLRWLTLPLTLSTFAVLTLSLSLSRTIQTEVYQLEEIIPPFDTFIIDLFTPFTSSLFLYGIILLSLAVTVSVLSFIFKKKQVLVKA